MIYTCDALLPTEQRYTSNLFRRVSRMVMLDEAEERQLLAFVAVVGEDAAKLIFHWNRNALRRVRALDHNIQGLADLNWRSVTVEDAEAIWTATRDGGWKGGPIPDVVRLMLFQRAHEGMSIPEIAKRYGLTDDQARRGSRWVRRARPDQSGVARAAAALGIA